MKKSVKLLLILLAVGLVLLGLTLASARYARERITAVDFAAEGPEAVWVRWQRNGDGGFDMAEMRVNGVARAPGV